MATHFKSSSSSDLWYHSAMYCWVKAAWNQHRAARQAGMHASLRRFRSCQDALTYYKETQRGRAVYETAEPQLQIAGPDVPARCQLISAFQKRSRRTMDRLTPPYKPGDRRTVNRGTGRQRGSSLHLVCLPAADLTLTCWWEVSHIACWELDAYDPRSELDIGWKRPRITRASLLFYVTARVQKLERQSPFLKWHNWHGKGLI